MVECDVWLSGRGGGGLRKGGEGGGEGRLALAKELQPDVHETILSCAHVHIHTHTLT